MFDAEGAVPTYIPLHVHYDGEADDTAAGNRRPEGVGTGATPVGVYEGEWVLGVPHGLGVFTATSAARYEGEWRGGLRCGVGFMSYSDMSVYRGEWLDGQRHGHGLALTADAEAVEGRWERGELVERFRVEGSSHEVEQAKLLSQVRDYEVCLKPMARAALANPVLPQSPAVAATTKLASLRLALHTVRVDAQLARMLAVLRRHNLDRDVVTPRAAARIKDLEFKLAFHRARETAAKRQTKDHIRFAVVYELLAEFAVKDLPYQQYYEEEARNLEQSLDEWRKLAELKMQEVNKLASELDRVQMKIRGDRYGPGYKYPYTNRPGWDLPLQPKLDRPPTRGTAHAGVRMPPLRMPPVPPPPDPEPPFPPTGTEDAEYGSVFEV